MEHLHHFRLSEDPFRNEPLLRFFFENRPQGDALRRLERGVRQAKGLCVLTGEVGSGKTMLVRQLLERLEEEVFEAGMMVLLHGAADANWLWARFASQLGVEEPAAEREALTAQIYERLAIVREDGRHAVLIIDDAQALAARRTLTDVCGLLKLEYEERRLLTLVLSGTPKLHRALARDASLAHRVDVQVQLGPLDPEVSAAYLAHRIAAAGGDASLLEPDAVAALNQLGRGRPGLMNTLADNALFEAFLCGRERIARVDVERAWRDLGWDATAPGRGAAPEAAEEPGLDSLDTELDAVFERSGGSAREPRVVPVEGPPKDEDGPEPDAELLVELLED